jgi:hypothetical protein
MAKPSGFDQLLTRPRRRETVTLVWDPNDAVQLQQAQYAAQEAVRAARRQPTPENLADAEAASAALETLRGEIGTVRFEFEGIGTRRKDKLMATVPPSKEQQRDFEAQGGRGKLGYDPERFPQKLIAACLTRLVLPDGTELTEIDDDQARALFERCTLDDQSRLFNAALLCDTAATSVEDQLKG